ncbi:unnamed protein product [Adineta steineri]|uniref:Shisa N-terminal domain-containing protein n=1 Tax=Adineta steineri TaxID=433720 RepID=A0A813PE98_9BILA|nr:unnamed protein product [Adineta steineri]CAF0822071.1 unnamed protein product [Adineta steineri]CAF0862534.1 unnamed protein product [Adineta steineri]
MNPEEQRTSCPGFLDEHGIWNNGFECPPLSGQRRICCGTDAHLYCCPIGNIHTNSFNRQEKYSLSINETTFTFIEKLNAIFFTLPILITCILIIIVLLLLILITLFVCYRYRQRNQNEQESPTSTKQTLLVDHFPFSPPHHQLFFNENNTQTCILHKQTTEPLTTSTSSTKSTRMPSNIYYNDWKEFFNTTELPMNLYPTMSSHSNENHNDDPYLRPNYAVNCTPKQQDDIIV